MNGVTPTPARAKTPAITGIAHQGDCVILITISMHACGASWDDPASQESEPPGDRFRVKEFSLGADLQLDRR
jgi:hypothetical protein